MWSHGGLPPKHLDDRDKKSSEFTTDSEVNQSMQDSLSDPVSKN